MKKPSWFPRRSVEGNAPAAPATAPAVRPTAHPAAHLALGAAGEEAALARLLRGSGRRLLARNWRPAGLARGLELDIVLAEGETVVFVEVKTRRADEAGEGENERPVYGAFTPAKRGKLVRAARHFLAAHDFWSRPCRFDLVCVRMDAANRATVEHYSNVVELGEALDCRNAAWQPW